LLAIGAAADTWIEEHQPALVMVQGDTTTAWALAQVAYCHQVGVAHVEAGLRTGDLCNPYPEEANRRLISVVADWNFAPTRRAAETLRREGARNVILTGNTIVDAIRGFGFQTTAGNTVPITIHRRENHRQLPRICAQLNAVAARCPELEFVFPMHPNPNVQQHRALLTAPNLRVIAPVDYPTMLRMISQARFLITDSGGLQEEALCFRKKVLVVRKVSERPETIEAGFGRLVDADIESGLDWALAPAAATADNPYGDGHSAARIVDALAPVIGAP
jgi:UDP-N-acetylglucosamine 2-epimerase (non-hydrolysing)